VNAGPLEICRLFLGEEKRKEWPEHHVLELDAAMKEFFKLCGFALVPAISLRNATQRNATQRTNMSRPQQALNGSLITDDQLPFQEKLKEGYADVRTQMSQYVDLKPPQSLDSSRDGHAM
jgi:hypothetical protein